MNRRLIRGIDQTNCALAQTFAIDPRQRCPECFGRISLSVGVCRKTPSCLRRTDYAWGHLSLEFSKANFSQKRPALLFFDHPIPISEQGPKTAVAENSCPCFLPAEWACPDKTC